MNETANKQHKSPEYVAFNGIIETIKGDLNYAFSQFDISKHQKEQAKREIVAALNILSDKELEEAR
jgi:hypothetical protein